MMPLVCASGTCSMIPSSQCPSPRHPSSLHSHSDLYLISGLAHCNGLPFPELWLTGGPRWLASGRNRLEAKKELVTGRNQRSQLTVPWMTSQVTYESPPWLQLCWTGLPSFPSLPGDSGFWGPTCFRSPSLLIKSCLAPGFSITCVNNSCIEFLLL